MRPSLTARLAIAIIGAGSLAAPARAQSAAPPPQIPATAFVVPDLPDSWNQYTSYENAWFSTRFSVVSIVDYNSFVQDENSRTQVASRTSGTCARSA